MNKHLKYIGCLLKWQLNAQMFFQLLADCHEPDDSVSAGIYLSHVTINSKESGKMRCYNACMIMHFNVVTWEIQNFSLLPGFKSQGVWNGWTLFIVLPYKKHNRVQDCLFQVESWRHTICRIIFWNTRKLFEGMKLHFSYWGLMICWSHNSSHKMTNA